MECPICFEKFAKSPATYPVITNCGHTFCYMCINKLTKCSICQTNIIVKIKQIDFAKSLNENITIPLDEDFNNDKEKKLLDNILSSKFAAVKIPSNIDFSKLFDLVYYDETYNAHIVKIFQIIAKSYDLFDKLEAIVGVNINTPIKYYLMNDTEIPYEFDLDSPGCNNSAICNNIGDIIATKLDHPFFTMRPYKDKHNFVVLVVSYVSCFKWAYILPRKELYSSMTTSSLKYIFKTADEYDVDHLLNIISKTFIGSSSTVKSDLIYDTLPFVIKFKDKCKHLFDDKNINLVGQFIEYFPKEGMLQYIDYLLTKKNINFRDTKLLFHLINKKYPSHVLKKAISEYNIYFKVDMSTPLHMYVKIYEDIDIEIIKLLSGFDIINYTDGRGFTPLHLYLSKKNCTDHIVLTLTSANNISLIDMLNYIPINMALSMKHKLSKKTVLKLIPKNLNMICFDKIDSIKKNLKEIYNIDIN